MEIDITEASTRQAALVHSIMRAAFAQYDPDTYPRFAAHSETIADVADAMRLGGAIIAWCGAVAVGSARFRMTGSSFIIERVAVLPEYQGHGIASIMMRYLEQLAPVYGYDHTELYSRLALPDNLAFYHHRGYMMVDTDPLTGRVTMRKVVQNPELIVA